MYGTTHKDGQSQGFIKAVAAAQQQHLLPNKMALRLFSGKFIILSLNLYTIKIIFMEPTQYLATGLKIWLILKFTK